MFCKLSVLAVVAPLVSALTIDIPTDPTSAGIITIFWSSAPTDPTTWSFELTNPSFNRDFAIANNVNPTAGNLTLTLPVVPVGDGYTIEAVNIGNITQVFAATGDFAIGAATSTSASSTSSGTSSTKSGSATSSVVVTTSSSSTSAATSNIVTSAQTTPTTPATSSTGNSTVSTTPFAGALSSRLDFGNFVGGIAAVMLSAVAGAALIAF